MASTDAMATAAPLTAAAPEEADVLVAVLSYNHEDSIERVLRAAQQGLSQLPGRKALLVQADGGSTDATLERARGAVNGGRFMQLTYPVHPVHRLAGETRALPGRESAYRAVFSLASELGAQALCVLDADLGLAPSWIQLLLEPILDSGFDLVAPRYQRHKFDGLITVGILYPMARAVFGKRIRQPTGSEFGFSAALIQRCLLGNGLESEGARHQVDLWVTLQALTADLRLCQASLGARTKQKQAVAPDLSDVMADAIGTLFAEMTGTAEFWQRVHGSQPIPTFGLRFDVDTAPAAVDLAQLLEGFRLGCESLQEVWASVLPPTVGFELRRLARQPEGAFDFPDELWARVLYDFAVGYKARAIGRDHLLRALTPLYLGWAASFVSALATAGAREVEERIEQLCLAFERQKPYLISRWRWPDRFAP